MDLDDIKHEKTRGNLKNLVSVILHGHLKYRFDLHMSYIVEMVIYGGSAPLWI